MRAKSIRLQVRAALKRGPLPKVALVSAVLAAVIFATEPVQAQSIICCSANIAVGGGWTGSSRVANCQQYFNSASTDILRRMCQQRAALSCLNTDRCSELPPGDTAAPDPTSGGADPPAGPDRDGLEQGFMGRRQPRLHRRQPSRRCRAASFI